MYPSPTILPAAGNELSLSFEPLIVTEVPSFPVSPLGPCSPGSPFKEAFSSGVRLAKVDSSLLAILNHFVPSQ